METESSSLLEKLLSTRTQQDCYGRTNLNGIFADWNFTNKGFKDNPCGHFGILTMSLSHHFINDIIDKEFEEV